MANQTCSLCGHVDLPDEIHHNILDPNNHLVCDNCAADLFPFNNIPHDILLRNFSNPSPALPLTDILQLENVEFDQLDYNDTDTHSPLSNIDPDLNYSQLLRQQNFVSNYITETQLNNVVLNNKVDHNAFSMYHMNIRSVPRHIQELNCYLNNIDLRFSIIGLSETWISNHTSGLYNLEGYDLVEKYRINRNGGGVSLYIRDDLKYIERNDLDIYDEHFESVFIELDKQYVNSKKNVIVGVIYRPPRTDLEHFFSHLNSLLEKLDHENKTVYLMGDFNLNLLNADSHKSTADFIETLFSHYYMPLINKATRITQNSSTLIDNMFCT